MDPNVGSPAEWTQDWCPVDPEEEGSAQWIQDHKAMTYVVGQMQDKMKVVEKAITKAQVQAEEHLLQSIAKAKEGAGVSDIKHYPIPNPTGYQYRSKNGDGLWGQWLTIPSTQEWIMEGLSVAGRVVVAIVCSPNEVQKLPKRVTQWRRAKPSGGAAPTLGPTHVH